MTTLQQEVKFLSSQLALVSKQFDKDATNIEGALHVPGRLKRIKSKPEPTIFDKVRKGYPEYNENQARGKGGEWTGGGGGAASHKPAEAKPTEAKPKGGMSRLTQALLIGGGLAAGGALLGPVGRIAATRLFSAARAATPAATAAARGARASTRLAAIHAERDALAEQVAAQRATTLHYLSQSRMSSGTNTAAHRAYLEARAKQVQLELQHKVLSARAKALADTIRSARQKR